MIHTDETKKKLSDIRRGDKNPFFGKHHSEEFKKRLSERTTAWNLSRQYDLEPQKVKIPETTDLAYLSGFCDADESIRFIGTDRKKRPFIAFYNTNKQVLDWILHKLEHGSLQYHNTGRERVESVRIDAAKDVYALASAMLPYLIVKKQDALAVISFLEGKYGEKISGGNNG
jgi:hypothetical protein